MNSSHYRCPECQLGRLRTSTTLWQCEDCGATYPAVQGIPKLYRKAEVGPRDRALRTSLYDGFLGRHYRHVMPFLTLPVRPAYWGGWLVYAIVVSLLLALFAYVGRTFFLSRLSLERSALEWTALFLLVGAATFLLRHRYLLFLLLLAVPVKVSLLRTRFKPTAAFAELHAQHIEELLKRTDRLKVLDVSTGTCNSLYRHGWMKLDAEYTALDFSETMLLQGLRFMTAQRVPVDFVLGDAARLPFASETFDVVLNYGAVNGYGDPRTALAEMARVARPGGLVLFLDEQLYAAARRLERAYFQRVLSSHNTIHRCPVELLPETMIDVTVHQVYAFYYLCTCRKAPSTPA